MVSERDGLCYPDVRAMQARGSSRRCQLLFVEESEAVTLRISEKTLDDLTTKAGEE